MPHRAPPQAPPRATTRARPMPSRRRTRAYQYGIVLICAAIVTSALWMVALQ